MINKLKDLFKVKKANGASVEEMQGMANVLKTLAEAEAITASPKVVLQQPITQPNIVNVPVFEQLDVGYTGNYDVMDWALYQEWHVFAWQGSKANVIINDVTWLALNRYDRFTVMEKFNNNSKLYHDPTDFFKDIIIKENQEDYILFTFLHRNGNRYTGLITKPGCVYETTLMASVFTPRRHRIKKNKDESKENEIQLENIASGNMPQAMKDALAARSLNRPPRAETKTTEAEAVETTKTE